MVQEAEEEGRVAMVVRAAELTVRQAAEVEVVAAPFFQALTALRPALPEAAGGVMASAARGDICVAVMAETRATMGIPESVKVEVAVVAVRLLLPTFPA
jgi:hypothetical protein